MKNNTAFSRLLTLRRFLRANQHIGMSLYRSDYALGYGIKHTSSPYTLWTIYADQKGGWSLFRAIPDIDKGIDVEDERLVIQTTELFLLKCRWDAEWYHFIYGEPPTVIRDTWEGKLAQAF